MTGPVRIGQIGWIGLCPYPVSVPPFAGYFVTVT